MKEKELRKLAKKRVSFKVHLMIYLTIIIFLAGINLFTDPSYLWFFWPAGGWGIAIVLHGIYAYGGIGLEESEYQKLKAEKGKK